MSAGLSCCAGCEFTGPRFLLLCATLASLLFPSERIPTTTEIQLRRRILFARHHCTESARRTEGTLRRKQNADASTQAIGVQVLQAMSARAGTNESGAETWRYVFGSITRRTGSEKGSLQLEAAALAIIIG
jgi:hypothetical protein